MSDSAKNSFEVRFPGDLDYIPAIRKYISELLVANNFSPKFAYRSEIIVDELCNNAVSFGCRNVDASVQLLCEVLGDRIEFVVTDEGGTTEHLEKLNQVLKVPIHSSASGAEPGTGNPSLGIDLIRMLSDEMQCQTDTNNLTSVRVVKMREDLPENNSSSKAA